MYDIYKYYKGESENPYSKVGKKYDCRAALWFSEKLFFEARHNTKLETKEELENFIVLQIPAKMPYNYEKVLNIYFDNNIPKKYYL